MTRMGRKRRHNKGLPSRVYMRGASYYYVRPNGKWVRLGKTMPEMLRRLSEIMDDTPDMQRMTGLFARYRGEVIPNKAPKTQRENLRALDRLEAVFGNAAPQEIRPTDVYAYLTKRSAPVAANREVAVLAHVFKQARQWGVIDTNPCIGVQRNRERPSDVYVTDAQFMAAYRIAPPMIRYAMAIAYLTGQRQADVLKLQRQHLLADGIYFKQAKTGNAVIVEWTPALRKTIRRASTHGGTLAFDTLIRTRDNTRYSSSGFQTAWKRLMAKLPEAMRFTFRDIRAKARSDGDDKRLLGHSNPEAMARTYQRTPVNVKPVR